ncbi:MAG: lytic polysaccharide monooxygenase [Actinomycetota bacterium]
MTMDDQRTGGLRTMLGVGLVVGGLAVSATALSGGGVGAHGSNADPPSRTFACRFLEPTNERCAAAWQVEPQALYDWMEVNIGDAAGRHRQLIPDGELCSAGRDKFAAFDVPGNWPVTNLTRERDGHTHVLFEATAPHATAYFRYYLTEPGWDPNQRLAWDDLELVYDSGALPAERQYHFDIWFPERTGQHILYMVWQRSDSPEAFYSCSDVTLDALTGPPPTTTPPSTVPPTTTPPTTPTPTTTVPSTGTWDPAVAYVAGDRVRHNGQVYVAKWWTRGFEPDTPVASVWDTPWRTDGAAPPTTNPVTTSTSTLPPATTTPPSTVPPTTTPPTTPTPTTTIPITGTWDPTAAYVAGDRVTHNGQVYVAKWWTRGFEPDTPVANVWDTPWRTDGAAPPTTPNAGTWNPAMAYVAGDRVVHDGDEYLAKWWTRGFEPDTPVVNAWDTPWLLVDPTS